MPVGFVDHRAAEDQYVEEDDERVEDGERGNLCSHQQLKIAIYCQQGSGTLPQQLGAVHK